jgi:hypothetical protein
VTDRLLVTCWHCLADPRDRTRLRSERVSVRLAPDVVLEGVYTDHDLRLDVALLELDPRTPLPVGWRPVPLRRDAGAVAQTRVLGLGWPMRNPSSVEPQALPGRVAVPRTTIHDGMPVMQLFSDAVAARLRPRGFSGGPVLVDTVAGQVAAGVICWMQEDEDDQEQAVGGTVYAVPAAEIVERWPELGAPLDAVDELAAPERAAPGLEGYFRMWEEERQWRSRDAKRLKDGRRVLNLLAAAEGPMRLTELRGLAPRVGKPLDADRLRQAVRLLDRLVVPGREPDSFLVAHPLITRILRKRLDADGDLRTYRGAYVAWGREVLAALPARESGSDDLDGYRADVRRVADRARTANQRAFDAGGTLPYLPEQILCAAALAGERCAEAAFEDPDVLCRVHAVHLDVVAPAVARAGYAIRALRAVEGEPHGALRSWLQAMWRYLTREETELAPGHRGARALGGRRTHASQVGAGQTGGVRAAGGGVGAGPGVRPGGSARACAARGQQVVGHVPGEPFEPNQPASYREPWWERCTYPGTWRTWNSGVRRYPARLGEVLSDEPLDMLCAMATRIVKPLLFEGGYLDGVARLHRAPFGDPHERLDDWAHDGLALALAPILSLEELDALLALRAGEPGIKESTRKAFEASVASELAARGQEERAYGMVRWLGWQTQLIRYSVMADILPRLPTGSLLEWTALVHMYFGDAMDRATLWAVFHDRWTELGREGMWRTVDRWTTELPHDSRGGVIADILHYRWALTELGGHAEAVRLQDLLGPAH